MKPRIKFCGLTRRDDLSLARDLGVDYLGVIAVPQSKRYVPLEALSALLDGWPRGNSQVVLLTQNASTDQLAALIAAAKPDLLQFHGQESPQACRQWGLPYIKAFHIQPDFDWLAAESAYADADAWLMDNGGGSGQVFDWSWAVVQRPRWWLAGGLKPDNVAAAIRAIRPEAVDVSSGIEVSAGCKDPEAMQSFVAQVRAAY